MKNRITKRLPRITELQLAALLLAGCASPKSPNAAAGNVLDDRVTSERVELALRRDSRFDFSHVRVRTDGGTVFLSGTVESAEAKKRAEELARTLTRVQKVENRLALWQSKIGAE
jgi:osmotically-inducible protein OsmY